VDTPTEIAMQSMRKSAAAAGVQPIVMLRLARFLGFENYESFRAAYKSWVSNPADEVYTRAAALAKRSGTQLEQKLVSELVTANLRNVQKALDPNAIENLIQARRMMHGARNIYLLGLRSLFPAAFYLQYVLSMVYDNVSLLTGLGGIVADEVRHVNHRDVLVVFNFYPYSTIAVQTTEFVRSRDAKIIAITDSAMSPAARLSDVVLLAQNAGATVFPSILPAIAVVETLAALIVSGEKEKGLRNIEEARAQLRTFNTYVEK
jgi:DNA-binding MurR/RpiR family transcriptional regulator